MVISPGLFSLLILAGVHFVANQARLVGWIWHGRFLSFACGITFAYVFVDLLPTLEKGQPILKKAFDPLIPYFDKHAYVASLLGVLFFYGLHTQSANSTRNYWLQMTGYLLFNLFVGASLADSTNPDIQPLALFTVAMGMHYFVNDHNMAVDEGPLYNNVSRWMLAAALFIGYAIGYGSHIPDAVVALTISFLSGGIILNALRYELPKREQVGYVFFLLGALIYTVIILGLA